MASEVKYELIIELSDLNYITQMLLWPPNATISRSLHERLWSIDLRARTSPQVKINKGAMAPEPSALRFLYEIPLILTWSQQKDIYRDALKGGPQVVWSWVAMLFIHNIFILYQWVPDNPTLAPSSCSIKRKQSAENKQTVDMIKIHNFSFNTFVLY